MPARERKRPRPPRGCAPACRHQRVSPPGRPARPRGRRRRRPAISREQGRASLRLASLRALLSGHMREDADVIRRPKLPRFSPVARRSPPATPGPAIRTPQVSRICPPSTTWPRHSQVLAVPSSATWERRRRRHWIAWSSAVARSRWRGTSGRRRASRSRRSPSGSAARRRRSRRTSTTRLSVTKDPGAHDRPR